LKLEQVLNTAKSLPADHVQAKQLGLTSAWIAKGLDGVSIAGGDLQNYDGRVAFTWRFPSLGAMAEEVERAFSKVVWASGSAFVDKNLVSLLDIICSPSF